jgi:hypothetical protein
MKRTQANQVILDTKPYNPSLTASGSIRPQHTPVFDRIGRIDLFFIIFLFFLFTAVNLNL